MQNNYYLFDSNINKDEALKKYIDSINKDVRFEKIIDERLLTIEEKYMSYYFIDSVIYNHPYFYVNKLTNYQVDGKIDILFNYTDPEFILNELSKNKAKRIEDTELILYDGNKYNNTYQNFLARLKEKGLSNILTRHNIKPSKNIYIDVSPLEGFDVNVVDSYFEKVYIFRYRGDSKKDDYVSILSSYSGNFYKLEFIYTECFNKYLLRYKRPLEYIPKDYLDYYYQESFNVYLLVCKKLDYEESSEILRKIKKNINYEAYSQYTQYLKTGIYYYRIRKYLKKLKIEDKPLKKHIYYAYLTLRYQAESGVFLYECASLNLLKNININEKINYLLRSYRLGSLEAKKLLYEHFSSSEFFNEAMVKKFS